MTNLISGSISKNPLFFIQQWTKSGVFLNPDLPAKCINKLGSIISGVLLLLWLYLSTISLILSLITDVNLV